MCVMLLLLGHKDRRYCVLATCTTQDFGGVWMQCSTNQCQKQSTLLSQELIRETVHRGGGVNLSLNVPGAVAPEGPSELEIVAGDHV